ncbi:SAM-dependent methyltransferase [Aequorivita sp. H23M31]|uniref:SAM-dependent methyltransferase n=1 Tax=Aequorivita ciconiae TaxID=2494375 RepID=A0A410G6A8_9FLAO|nr:class I SAM-dependent methyltransferase [Aequorivita sp. H23M31]QAA82725.1 SAM-dependent methyltransferase [Aequorivita sp. H23M31]
MDNNYFKSQENLQKYVDKIERVFNTDSIINEDIDKTKVQKYYRESNAAYNLVHSKDGSVHMAVNYDGIFNDEGYYQQVKEINEYIKPNFKVLELGCGKGFNSHYLASSNTKSQFHGIDISKTHLKYAKKRAKNLRNLQPSYGNFHSLNFDDNTFDIVFELESVCHSDSPKTVLDEVYRVLKTGGKFILYDGFRTENYTTSTALQKKSALLVEKTMAVNTGHTILEWLEIAKESGFEISVNDDISLAIMPNLKRFHRLAKKYFKYYMISKFIMILVPKNLIKNTIAGILLPFSIMQNLQSYQRIVLTKKG